MHYASSSVACKVQLHSTEHVSCAVQQTLTHNDDYSGSLDKIDNTGVNTKLNPFF